MQIIIFFGGNKKSLSLFSFSASFTLCHALCWDREWEKKKHGFFLFKKEMISNKWKSRVNFAIYKADSNVFCYK